MVTSKWRYLLIHISKIFKYGKEEKIEAKIGIIVSVSLINYKCILKP